MTLSGSWLLRLAQTRSARAGLFVLAATLAGFAAWELFSPLPFCEVIRIVSEQVGARPLLGLMLLFVWSLVLFLTVLPLGTITVLTAGFLFGPVAGLVQFAAVLVSSLILFEWSRARSALGGKSQLQAESLAERLADLARRRGLITSAVLRLLPVVPSAVATLTATLVGLSRRDFMLGTLLAGWVRPVAFAVLGSLAGQLPACG